MAHDPVPIQFREIKDVPMLCHAETSSFHADDEQSIREMLLSNWGDGDAWILGHCTDGVLWGKISKGKLIVASDAELAFGPLLEAGSLLDLRIFSPAKELRIWRRSGKLTGCVAWEEASKGDCPSYDEDQIFLSAFRDGKATIDGVPFSILRGRSGQMHAVPVDWDGRDQRWRLKVRHYLNCTETGMLIVTESRLLNIIMVP